MEEILLQSLIEGDILEIHHVIKKLNKIPKKYLYHNVKKKRLVNK